MTIRAHINLIENPQSLYYHLTDHFDFSLNADYAPEDNTISYTDRSGIKGLYLTRDVERWVNGYGYKRPFVVELIMAAPEEGGVARWGGETFVPADQFNSLTITRVMPLDAKCREEFGMHGWLEREAGIEFDTGNPITAKDWEQPFRGYRFEGDTRTMRASDPMIKRVLKSARI